MKNYFQEEHIVFEVGLEIREDDGKGNFVYVPRLLLLHLFRSLLRQRKL